MLRIGHGFDVHAFGPGTKIVLGGVTIPNVKSLVAHSDGDVLLHALCDALLGAAALGDIGQHFPDTDPALHNIDSRRLLCRSHELIVERGWKVANIDSTVIAQEPRLAPHIGAMCANIGRDLQLPPECVNVKATTTERLGYIGRCEGIAAHAVVLLYSE